MPTNNPTINIPTNKINRYLSLLGDQKKLVNSSKSIIRKKKSPLAIKIKNGDVPSIRKAAKSRVFGSLNQEKKDQLCKLLCDLKRDLKDKISNELGRDFIVTIISAAVSILDGASGLLISLLWLIKYKINDVICDCKLNQLCTDNQCPHS